MSSKSLEEEEEEEERAEELKETMMDEN